MPTESNPVTEEEQQTIVEMYKKGVKLVEISFFRQPFDFYQFFYMALILIGIVGLKRGA